MAFVSATKNPTIHFDVQASHQSPGTLVYASMSSIVSDRVNLTLSNWRCVSVNTNASLLCSRNYLLQEIFYVYKCGTILR